MPARTRTSAACWAIVGAQMNRCCATFSNSRILACGKTTQPSRQPVMQARDQQPEPARDLTQQQHRADRKDYEQHEKHNRMRKRKPQSGRHHAIFRQ